ncbi:glutamate mutase L [Emergencia timonensis]|uniref:glutamate mutase L n=1 Tax=Emergencia timonensis TaxID=1776384 RepID=UPI003992094A
MKHAITVDFGSTFTKIVVIDLEEREILLSDRVASSVGTDAAIGLNRCFQLAETVIGHEAFEKAVKLASSSAAGGLRMSVIGLTNSLSTLAGKSAALGAGGKIIANYSGLMTGEKVKDLEGSKTEIVLLCGGYERGNTSMVWKNTQMLAHSSVQVPIIYSGNSALGKDVRKTLTAHGKQCFTVENIIPELGVLNVEPTQDVIRNLFLERITDMKGFRNVKREFDNQFVPTPVAVLTAGELLNKGTDSCQGLGPLMIVDVGGATTDVYSFNENKSYEGAKLVGLAEPFGKRTVEGDLGMRETSSGVMKENDVDAVISALAITEDQLREAVDNRTQNTDFLPDNELEKHIDDMIAKAAVYAASRRHTGKVMPSYNKSCQNIQVGKNLSEVSKVIGTGGILVHNPNPSEILKAVERQSADKGILLPEAIEPYLDTEYVLFAAGLLKEIDEDAAIEIMMKSIRRC